ncbi:sulfatase [Halorubrum ezzemoulense]|uniref:sulfatase n=1 Tax=Halorubrum ezzemoulense TaxID=337243 RepID=UPI00232E88D2|nr:sulfatase [Halorubrum ezzemoulense]MDB9252937.1 sulfatase [Halorubrum ezzemoulense]MDB9256679.1 sulfatase [Halorubrum ezzemoulense]MDB9278246.1 sulfatase [Halorubrum ezzemoulense]
MKQPNIVWLTMESTRFDHTSMGGYYRNTTPNIQKIANDSFGVSFSSCMANATWTLPSSASILTGNYPSYHKAGMGNGAIPNDLPTLPEKLEEAGYATSCFSTHSYLSPGTNLDRGFTDFHWLTKSNILNEIGMKPFIKYLFNIRSCGGGLSLETNRHKTDFLLLEAAKDDISELSKQKRPFFQYVHLVSPHHPYQPPIPFIKEIVNGTDLDAGEVMKTSSWMHENFHQLIADGLDLSENERNSIIAAYDAEIKYTDYLIGELFDYIQENISEETLLVITSDHGEFFGERGMLSHKIALDDPVHHVPLVIHGMNSEYIEEGQLIQHIDVTRTVAELANANTTPFHGHDFREKDRDFAVIQQSDSSTRVHFEKLEELNPEFDRTQYHQGDVDVIRDDDYKYISSKTKEELRSITGSEEQVIEDPQKLEEYSVKLKQFLSEYGGSYSDSEYSGDYSSKMEQQLENLGYL